MLAAVGAGRDAELALWDAMCQLERRLQARRDTPEALGRGSHAEILNAE